MSKSLRTKELGKGIRALLSSADDTSDTKIPAAASTMGTVTHIPVDLIHINPFQPRTEFDEQALQELSDSIKTHGLIQPVTLRKLSADSYQLISGERRLRASKLAGIKEIPAYIRSANDQEMLEMALIENIQRENLNAIEVALSLQRLIDECALTHESLSDRVNKNRSTVTNYLRLLKLPPDIQNGIKNKMITMGHARSLVGVSDLALQLSIYKEILTKNLSVREVEALIKKYNQPKVEANKAASSNKLPEEYINFKNRISNLTGMKTDLSRNADGSGKLSLSFSNDNDLNNLLELLNK